MFPSATKDSSPGFAYLLAKYLVDKLEDMGGTEAEDRPMLYSRLFRLLFGSVQCQVSVCECMCM